MNTDEKRALVQALGIRGKRARLDALVGEIAHARLQEETAKGRMDEFKEQMEVRAAELRVNGIEGVNAEERAAHLKVLLEVDEGYHAFRLNFIAEESNFVKAKADYERLTREWSAIMAYFSFTSSYLRFLAGADTVEVTA